MADLVSTIMGSDAQSSTWEELYREYLDNRMLVLNANIDENVIEDYIMYIIKWNKDDIDIPIDKRRKIRLLITSPGGNAFNGNILADVIMQSKTPIMGVGLDLVASAAYQVFLACDERVAFQGSVFLQHEGDLSMENSRSKFKQTVEFFDGMEERAKEYVLSRTSMTSDFYDDIYEQEYWMDAHKAKQLGVIHRIIGEDCDIDVIFSEE
jgi:ATP-dependent protease ClpP protease subunit